MTAVLFDLDGTLIDSAPDLATAVNRVIVPLGHEPIGPERIRRIIGGGARELLKRAISAPDEASVAHLTGPFLEAYEACLLESTVCYPGTHELLAKLAQEGAALGLVTNKSERPTHRLLGALGLARWFGDAVLGGDSLPEKKPSAAPLREALRRLGHPEEGVVMVGDSSADLRAARALGCPCVLVTFGYSPEPVAELGADALIDELSELPAVVRRLVG